MAERSISINLRARVSGFVAGMREAKGETQNLSRQMTETGASADRMRRRLEAATKALPKIKIDADSTAAEIKFAQLRSQMESLGDKKIGIDISAADAMTQIREIERELEQLQRNEADINIRADIGEALAELRAVDAEISRVNGRTADVRVDADVSGALRNIALIGGALASLPAVTTIAVGVTALGGAFAAAGAGAAAFGAVAVPALGRINDALKAQETAAKAAGGATGGAGQSAAQAAQQALQLEQAERRLKDAQNEERAAQEDLTRAREAGRRALEDMNFSLERSILSQKDAALAVREAEARLAELQGDPKATALEIERAQLSLEMAQQRAREQEVKTQRARKDTAEANAAGVKGTKEYQDALDNLRQTQDKVAQAEQQLKLLHLQQQAAMAGGGGAAAKLKDAFADLSKEEKELAKNIKSFKDEYIAWQRSLEPDVFPVINKGLDLMRLGLKEAGPLAKSASAGLLQFGQDAEAALRGQFWQAFLFDLNTNIPGAITTMGRIGIDTFTGFAGIIKAVLPYGMELLGNIEHLSDAFADWGAGLESNQQFHQFMADVKETAPEVWALIKDVAKALVSIGEAVAPLSTGAFSGLSLLAKIISGMDPERIQAIAIAIGAIKLASMGMNAAAAWQGLAGGISATGTAAGKAQGKVAAFGKAAVGVSAGVIGFELLGSAMNDLAGHSEGMGELTLALTELGQTGKWAGDLGEQWGGTFDDASKAAELFGDGLRELQDPSFGEMFWLHPLSELTAILPGIDSSVDILEQKFSDMDKVLAGMVTSGNADTAARAFQELAKQAQAQGIPVEKLNQLLPTYNQSLRVAGNAAAEAAAGVDKGKLAMDGFNSSLDAFSSRTDALTAMQNLKTAYNAAEQAINAANGKLQVSATMTDRQRDAVIQARQKFSEYITAVKGAADGAATLSGKTSDATLKILEQLPKLGDLAGKNSEAREQVLKLAEAYGISREDAEKAMKSAKDFQDVLNAFKNKQIYIKLGLDTTEAQESFERFVKKVGDRQLAVSLMAKQNMPARAGGIFAYARGGLQKFAAGGRSTPPNMATGPTILYGEGADQEAFIPYEDRYRDRAIGLLAQVANDFGLQLNNAQAAQGMADLSVTIDDSGLRIVDGLTGVMGSLQNTMGETGTLTSSISKVGSSADQLNQSWLAGSAIVGDTMTRLGTVTSDAVTVMTGSVTTSVDGLTSSVDALAAAVGAAKQAASSASSKSSSGKKDTKPGMVAGSGPKSSDGFREEYSVAGSYGLDGPGYVSTHESAFVTSRPVNYSQVSAPQQSAPAPSSSTPAERVHGSSGTWGRDGMAAGPAVVIQNQTVNNDVDANMFAESVAMKVRARGR
ncbi:hypothetical protein FH608_046045 [Nonomuraea phyllanthi]|uniref:Uncharacterized protein n=1 Tax=Nonomuraea phyllanthi TaxID=2219224 RepID=A0A5C4V8P3_9ACTN|nr:hypothetical protein [Nonomuraea phyllanthi]KAB8186858.1 hypothetical protein FH608_046045 [Nonomuraea phyllanthi]